MMVFWNYSQPLEDYLSQHCPDESSSEATIEEALKLLTPFHNDHGQKQVLSGGEFVHFIASVVHDDDDDDENNELAATVDVHQNNEIDTAGGVRMIVLELKNLRVKDQYRRRGIGRALVQTVQNYAREQCSQQLGAIKATVYLHVELDNDSAIPLYISQGFQFDSNEECKMTWTCSCPI